MAAILHAAKLIPHEFSPSSLFLQPSFLFISFFLLMLQTLHRGEKQTEQGVDTEVERREKVEGNKEEIRKYREDERKEQRENKM